MTEEDREELLRLNGVLSNKKLSVQWKGSANTFGKNPEQLKEISGDYQISLAEYSEAQSAINKFMLRWSS